MDLSVTGPEWDREAPAPEADVAALADWTPAGVPDAYFAFLRQANGGEGELRVQPWWFRLWWAGEVRASHEGYQLDEFHPGRLAFGSSGGGMLFAFDLRDPSIATPVVAIDANGAGEEDIMLVASDFDAFVRHIGHPGAPDR